MPVRFISLWLLRLAVPLILLIAIIKIQGFLADFAGEQRLLRQLNFDFYQSVVLRDFYQNGQFQGSGFLKHERDIGRLKENAAVDLARFDRHGHFHPVLSQGQLNAWRELSSGCLGNSSCVRLEQEFWDSIDSDNSDTNSSVDVDLLEHLQWLNETLNEAFYFDRLELVEASSETQEKDIDWDVPVFINSGHFAETWQREMFDVLDQTNRPYTRLSLGQLPQVAQLSAHAVGGVFYKGRFAKDIFILPQLSLLLEDKSIAELDEKIESPSKLPAFILGRKQELNAVLVEGSYSFKEKHLLSPLDLTDDKASFFPTTTCQIVQDDVVCERHLANKIVVLSGEILVESELLVAALQSRLNQARQDGAKLIVWDLALADSYEILAMVAKQLKPKERIWLTRAWSELAMQPWELFSLLEAFPSVQLMLNPGSDYLEVQKLFLALSYFTADWQEWISQNNDRLVAAIWHHMAVHTSEPFLRQNAGIVYQWLYNTELSVSVFHQRGYSEWYEPGLYLQNLAGLGFSEEKLSFEVPN